MNSCYDIKNYVYLIQYRYNVLAEYNLEGYELLKFLHIGDVHLDTSFYSKSEALRRKLREGIRSAFSKAVDFCIQQRVDALLIAGDLFDNDKLSFKTERFLINEFNRLRDSDIRVFYSTGNHDPGHISYRANSIKWPDNVYLFKDDKVQAIAVKDSNNEAIYNIVSCGHKTNSEGRNLVKEFPIKENKVPHIGLVHTMVTSANGAGGHDRYLPCSKEDMESKGYDYWALGHIHKRQSISDKSQIYYPGNIQGRHPKETGKKGGLLVTVDKNHNITVDFKVFSSIEWYTLIIDKLDNIKEYNELKRYISNQIRNCIEKNSLLSRALIFRVELMGRAYLKEELKISENIEDIIEDLILDLDLLDLEIKTDGLLGLIDVKDYAEGNHVLSKVFRLLDDIDGNEELVHRLVNIPLLKKGLRKREERMAYIKELLEGTEEELLSYMVGDEDEDK